MGSAVTRNAAEGRRDTNAELQPQQEKQLYSDCGCAMDGGGRYIVKMCHIHLGASGYYIPGNKIGDRPQISVVDKWNGRTGVKDGVNLIATVGDR